MDTTVTEFEHEILQIMSELLHKWDHWTEVCGIIIHLEGQERLGDHWGGRRHATLVGPSNTPTIDAAIGRLRRKGLVEQIGTHVTPGSNRHTWNFTEAGRDLMGMTPVAS